MGGSRLYLTRPGPRVAALTVVLAIVAGCSSSSTEITAPTTVRCAVELVPSRSTVEAAGGNGEIHLATNRDCPWEARSTADWLTLTAPARGQGDGELRFTASANTLVSPRRAEVVVNDQRVEIAQSGAPCSFDLGAGGASVAAEGGSLSVSVSAQPTCTWTAVSEVDWVRVEAGARGDGSGNVAMGVSPNAGPARNTTVLIAGHGYAIAQAGRASLPPAPPPQPGCQFTVSPQSESFPPSGGGGTVAVRASASSCVWTTVSSASWISVANGSGSGSGEVRYVVAANTGAARTGILTVAGRAVTVNQAAAPETGTIDLRGEVSGVTGQCPTLTFSLEGRLVRTNAATDFRERCDRIESGRRLRITGVVQGDGSVLAVRVREGD
jgi:Putative binding domain, N-terminal/Domain of unknown function (DUF5666)